MDETGVLRRSLRRINPFRKDLFRLPATPRLSRKGGNKETETDWNFEKGLAGKKKKESPAPTAQEAQDVIRVGLSELCASLPHTTYDSQGNVDRVSWTESPHSTISLMSRNNYRMSISSRRMNGIFQKNHRLSAIEPITKIPIFRLENFFSQPELNQPFIGREWIFREIYEAAILDKVDITFIQGKIGSGKSEIVKQIVLHSSFYTNQDTVESSNYEWLKAVSARTVAWHFCDIQDAATCSIPEFICNISAWLSASKILKSYAYILSKDEEASSLLTPEECTKHDPIEIFKRVICKPLQSINSMDEGCLLIVVDGIDHAEFHRTDDGGSIGTFLNKIRPFLPSWIKLLVTGEEFGKFENIQRRTISIDSLDERTNRDLAMLAENVFFSSNITCPEEMVEQLVHNAKGSSLYIVTAAKFLTFWTTRNMNIYTLPKTVEEFLEHWLATCTRQKHLTLTESAILDVLLSSLSPKTAEKLFDVLLQAPYIANVTNEAVSHAIEALEPLVKKTESGIILLRSTSIRNFLVHTASEGFNVRQRNGHMLLALDMTSLGNLSPDAMFRTAHHLLKANPLKYLRQEFQFDFTRSRQAYSEWMRLKSSDIKKSLCSHRFLRYPNLKATAFLIGLGAEVDVEFDGTSVVQVAAQNRFFDLILLLLQNSDEEKTLKVAARTASCCGDVETMRRIGGDLDSESTHECCLLAASRGSFQMFSLLLKLLEAFPSEVDDCLREAVVAAVENDQSEILEYLLQRIPTNLDECMRIACLSTSSNVICMLLSRGVALSTEWPPNTNPIHCAVEQGSWQMLMAALAAAAASDINELVDGRAALHLAAQKADPMIVDLLISHKANVNIRDDSGATPLFSAVRSRRLDAVKTLLRAGAEPNLQDSTGNWLCHVAASSSDVTILQTLMDSGMDVNARDSNGDRPIEIAIGRNQLKIVQLLVARGARLRGVTWERAIDNNFEVVFMLLNKLLEDASLLARRKKPEEALHRLDYAIDRCDRLAGLRIDQESRHHLQETVRSALISKGKLLRRSGNLEGALECCARADTPGATTFDVCLLRAKCLFDARQVHAAREEAAKALRIKPFDDECRNLLAVLQYPQTHIARF